MQAGFGDEAAFRHRFAEAQQQGLLGLMQFEGRGKAEDHKDQGADGEPDEAGRVHGWPPVWFADWPPAVDWPPAGAWA